MLQQDDKKNTVEKIFVRDWFMFIDFWNNDFLME